MLGEPAATATLRASPEDFEVEELPRIDPAGEGGHLWLWVEKRGANTPWVADQLARAAGCHGRDAGFAGMKDRHALTRQWYSVPLQGTDTPEWSAWRIEGVRVLDARRHTRKLQRGALEGNRFRLVLRNVEGDGSELEQRLQRIAAAGLPNYFGEQRFGHDGGNVERGTRWLLEGGRVDRRKKGIYLSAVRSALFNEVLGRRVAASDWNELLPGEVAMLDGTRSVFAVESVDEELAQRCHAFDVHPTGPLPGRGGVEPGGAAAEVEREALAPFSDTVAGLSAAGLDAERRSLRLKPAGFEWRWLGCDIDSSPKNGSECSLELRFELPAGAYATAVLRELVRAAT